MSRCPDCGEDIDPVETGTVGSGITIFACPECDVIISICEHSVGG